MRLLDDVEWLERRYKIFITDGYATSGHAMNGEHPIGLALDIVPNAAAGGSWKKITKLARWAEPQQNQPRAPFRWVGYNGDAGHGRGHHLHLSWMHSETKPKQPAEVVYTRLARRRRQLRWRQLGQRPVRFVAAAAGAAAAQAPMPGASRSCATCRSPAPTTASGWARASSAGASPRLTPRETFAEPRKWTVRPVVVSGLRALASWLARARLYRGTCGLSLKAASFRT